MRNQPRWKAEPRLEEVQRDPQGDFATGDKQSLAYLFHFYDTLFNEGSGQLIVREQNHL